MLTGIIVPGRGYGPQAPLLDLAAEALTDRDASVVTIDWKVPDGLLETDPEPFVRSHVAAALHGVSGPVVIVGKSLGSYAASLVASLSLPAVWLTPLLYRPSVASAIARNPAPALLIGGTADPSWDAGVAAASGKTVLTIDDADHGLRPPGPLRAYTDALGRVGEAVEEFLDEL